MFFSNNNNNKPQNNSNDEKLDYKKLQDERKKLKKEIEKSLKDLYFTSDQVKEVLNIVDKAQDSIQVLKDSLIGTNINQLPGPVEKATMEKIEFITKQMHVELKSKVKEIMFRRKLM